MPRAGPGFRLSDAYEFAKQQGLGQEAEAIARMEIHPSSTKPAAVRKGCLVELFESAGVMEKFIEQCWAARYTPAGERRDARFRQQKNLNQRHLEGEPVDELADDDEEEEPPAFALEAHLRDFLAANLARIGVGAGKVTLYQGDAGRVGVEYPTDVGPIDILGRSEQGTFYIFELKLSRGADRAVGQLARYMGWVKRNLAADSEVVGVIVASSVDEKTRYAASAIPNVKLFEYEVQFRLTNVSANETAE